MRYIAMLAEGKISALSDITYDDIAKMQDIIAGDNTTKWSTLRHCQDVITQYVALAKTYKDFASVKICIFWSDLYLDDLNALLSKDPSQVIAEVNRYNLTIFKNGVPDTREINRQLYLPGIQDEYMD
jgi:hypothetical protein